MGETFIRENVFVGYIDGEWFGYRNDSARVLVDVRMQQTPGEHETTDHGTITDPMRLSIMAGVRYRRHQNFRACGQFREALDHIVRYAPGWDETKVTRLREIWDRWHLNDVRAACDHNDNGPCPVTGYRAGSKWLTDPLPDYIYQEIRDMFAGDTGTKLPDEIPWD